MERLNAPWDLAAVVVLGRSVDVGGSLSNQHAMSRPK
jgi:hypothetical protein